LKQRSRHQSDKTPDYQESHKAPEDLVHGIIITLGHLPLLPFFVLRSGFHDMIRMVPGIGCIVQQFLPQNPEINEAGIY